MARPVPVFDNSILLQGSGGTQSQTAIFSPWEEHTRGMASKLMVGMGYVKGACLGRKAGGQLHPIQVPPPPPPHHLP